MDDDFAKELEALRDERLYQPNKEMGEAMMKREPYLKEPAWKFGEIHANSDHRLEELTADDMDLPIDFV